jgi:hypothetical protein
LEKFLLSQPLERVMEKLWGASLMGVLLELACQKMIFKKIWIGESLGNPNIQLNAKKAIR